MQQEDFEVQFCDLCGTSVPLSDLENGAAVRHQAKTIGACCLNVLRKGDSPLVSPGLPDEKPAAPRRSEHGLLPLALALAVAIAGATIFLDLEIDKVRERLATFASTSSEIQRSNADVLQAVDQALDGVARKGDLDGLYRELGDFGEALSRQQQKIELLEARLQRGLDALRQKVEEGASSFPDYRPLFDDLRQQIVRQGRLLADLGDAAVAPTPEESSPSKPPSAGDSEVAAGLPTELAEQVRRLADEDAAVRFEAVDRLLVSKNLAVLPSVLPMVHDPDGFVRRLTVEGLRDFVAPAVVEALIDALGDADETVADTAWGSLKHLTGQKFPFDASAPSRDLRARQQRKWRDWWADNKGSFGS